MEKFSELFGTNGGLGAGSVDSSQLPDSQRHGLVPLGAVIPVMSSTAGAYLHPGGASVRDRGLQRCNGEAIIGGPLNGQLVPQLTDQRFLRGSTSSGNLGGSNTKSVPITILPSHGHSASTGGANMPHGHVGSPNGTSVGGSHVHGQYVTANAGTASSTHDWNSDGGVTRYPSYVTQSGTIQHGHPVGAVPSGGGHGHPVSMGGGGGSGAAFDIQPNYVNVVYVMRVE